MESNFATQLWLYLRYVLRERKYTIHIWWQAGRGDKRKQDRNLWINIYLKKEGTGMKKKQKRRKNHHKPVDENVWLWLEGVRSFIISTYDFRNSKKYKHYYRYTFQGFLPVVTSTQFELVGRSLGQSVLELQLNEINLWSQCYVFYIVYRKWKIQFIEEFLMRKVL